MSLKTAEVRRRQTALVGKTVANHNGHKGHSQRGCFGNHVNSLNIKKEK